MEAGHWRSCQGSSERFSVLRLCSTWPGAGGGEGAELVFNGYGVSGLQDEHKVWRSGVAAPRRDGINATEATPEMVKMVIFKLRVSYCN